MSRSALSLLVRTRRRINLIIAGTEAMKAVFWAGIVAIPVVVASPWIGLKNFGFAIWAYVVIIGGLIGCGIGWFRRLDLYGTARWLDGKIKDGELFSAAMVCLGRDLSGPYDGEIVARAERLASSQKKLLPPLRAFGGRLALAAASSLVFAGFIVFWNPRSGEASSYLFFSGSGTKSGPGSANSSRETAAELRKSPESIAKALFPQDDEAAKLAEKAIREGDDETLRKLLADEGTDYRDEMDVNANGENSEDGKGQDRQNEPPGGSPRDGSASRNKADGGNSESYTQGESQGDEFMYGDNPGYQGASGEAARAKDGQGGQGSLGRQEGVDSSEEGAALGAAGTSGWGTGEGYRVDRGKVDSKSGTGELLLQKKGGDRFLQLVLPEKKVSLPPTKAVAASGRVAEAAIARKGVPIEYEEFVKSYFEALSGAGSGGKE